MNLANAKKYALVWSLMAASALSITPRAGNAATVRMSFPDVGPTIAVVGIDRSLHPAVDLVYVGNEGGSDYDLVVAPYADAKHVRMSFYGASRIRVDGRSGDLLMETADHTQIRHIRAQIYQKSAGHTVAIEGHYRLLNDATVGLTVASYNRSLPLMINATVVFTTFATEFEAR